jgi:hypothetical protein
MNFHNKMVYMEVMHILDGVDWRGLTPEEYMQHLLFLGSVRKLIGEEEIYE